MNTQPKQNCLTCSGHTRPVVQLQYSPVINDEFYLISACKDGKPILRNGKTGDWIGTFLGHKGAVWCANLSKDSKLAVTGSADFSAKLWNAETGEEISSFSHKHIVRACCFNDTGSQFLTAGYEKQIRLFDVNNASETSLFPKLEKDIKFLAWDEKNNTIYSAGEDQFIRVWDPRTLSEVKKLEVNAPVSNLSISMDSKWLQVCYGKQASFFDSESLNLIKEFNFDFEVSSISIKPETRDKFVIGATSNTWVYNFDFETGNQLEIYKGHHGPVHSISYSPDGEIYASGSEDGTIRLWQSEPGKPYGLWQLKTEAEV